LFFTKDSSEKLLKLNHEIFIMNCIYKINRYRISLLVIMKVMILNMSFYIIFIFQLQKITEDYI